MHTTKLKAFSGSPLSYYALDFDEVKSCLAQLGHPALDTVAIRETHGDKGQSKKLRSRKSARSLAASAQFLKGHLKKSNEAEEEESRDDSLESSETWEGSGPATVPGQYYARLLEEISRQEKAVLLVTDRTQLIVDNWWKTVEDFDRESKRFGYDDSNGLKRSARRHCETIAMRTLEDVVTSLRTGKRQFLIGVDLSEFSIRPDRNTENCFLARGQLEVTLNANGESWSQTICSVVASARKSILLPGGEDLASTGEEVRRGFALGKFKRWSSERELALKLILLR